ncbi:trypsin-like serine protease [Nonomuraea sp. M3C6]|uniref:Trypsin-like serine protease n=1 Tax=Nonomuraea marmarensis TaxID=3351344 RepID=A0ABW7A7C9_9ACTN
MRFVPFVVILAVSMVGITKPASAITNGFADGNAHPEVGALIDHKPHSDGTWTYCSGTLISPTVFLTAAHCGLPKQRTARVSFASRYQHGAKVYTGKYVPDTRFTEKSELHDMAVVIFSTPIQDIEPAQLPESGMLDRLKAANGLKEARFTPVGYGSLSPAKLSPGKKKHGSPYRYTDTRNQTSISFKALSRGWLDLSLSSKGDGSTCFGDSGGPNFLGGPDSHLLVATSISGADDACKKTNYDYRLDTASARHFLGRFVTLP